MSFEDRFELGALLRDDGVQTFAAKDRTGGPDLLAHFFSNPAEAAELSDALDRLPPREKQRIVHRGERAGTAYVVTGNLPGYVGFREWLAENGRAARPLDAAGAWKVILPEHSVDEQFLALFPTGERVQANAETAVPSSPPPPPAHATVDPVGEFTRMFQAMPPAAPHPASESMAPASAAEAPPASQAADAPGEFTRMFQAPQSPSAATQPASAQPAAPAPRHQPDGPGEFTRFFEAQVHESKAPVQPFPPSAPSHPVSPRQGEFTRVFGRGEIRGDSPAPLEPPPAVRNPTPPPVESARLFEPEAGAAKPAAPQGPGDYTRRFSATPALTLGQAAETPARGPASFPQGAAPAASARSAHASRWPLILGIAAIVVSLAAVILFLVARAK